MARTTRTFMRFAALLAIAGALAAGCGSDDKDSAADEKPSETTTTAKLTGTPVKFSMMTVLAGPGFQPGREQGAKAAAKAINAAGGINGHPLEIISCDTGLTTLKPTGAIDCAKAAIKAGVIASTGDAQGDANVLQAFNEANIAEIGAFPINAGDYTAENSFPLQAGGPVSLAGQARLLAENGAKKIALLALEIPQAEFSKTFANIGLKPLGTQIDRMVLVPSDPSTDFAPYIARATSDGVDGLIVALTGDGLIRAVKGARQAGYTGAISGLSVALNGDTIKSLGSLADGLNTVGAYEAPGGANARIKQYRKEMQAYAGDAPISEYSLEPWIAVHFAAERLAKLTTMDAKSLKDSLPGSAVDLHGVSPSFSFSTPSNPFPGLARIFQVEVQYQVVKDGKVVPLGDGAFVDVQAPKK